MSTQGNIQGRRRPTGCIKFAPGDRPKIVRKIVSVEGDTFETTQPEPCPQEPHVEKHPVAMVADWLGDTARKLRKLVIVIVGVRL